MEYLDLYDRDRIATGDRIIRGESLPADRLHLVVHICLFNSANQLLIQRRQPFKQGWPGYWDVSVGGTAQAGETSAQAAKREVREEIGYDTDFSRLRPHLTVQFARGFDDWYLLHADAEPESFALQPEEVQAVRWTGCEEILRMIADGRFIPYDMEFIRLLFLWKDRSSGGFISKE